MTCCVSKVVKASNPTPEQLCFWESSDQNQCFFFLQLYVFRFSFLSRFSRFRHKNNMVIG